MSIAFFDIDKTILSVNSAKLWLRHELEQRTISKRQAARGAVWAGLYGLGVVDVEKVIRQAVTQVKGRQEVPLIEQTASFYERHVAHTVRPGALRAIDEHRERGEYIVLLTSSSNYIAELVCEQVGADGFLCNRFVVEDGVLTGALHEPLCYHAGKVKHARGWALERDVRLRDCSFYTDSYTDLPMLEVVGAPQIVAPDPRLARVARQRGWPVLDWDR